MHLQIQYMAILLTEQNRKNLEDLNCGILINKRICNYKIL